MKIIFSLILSLFFLQILYSQNNLTSEEEVDKEFKKLLNAQTEDDVKKIEHLIKSSEKINYKSGVVFGKMKILEVFYYRSDYEKMSKLIQELELLELNHQKKSQLYLFKSYLNKELGIETEELQSIKTALLYAQKIEKPGSRHFQTSKIYNRYSIYYDYKISDSLIYYLKKELEELEQISDDDLQFRNSKLSSIVLNYINIGNYYVGVHEPQRLDLAEPYFLKAYEYKNTHPEIFDELDMPILCGLGNFYVKKSEFDKSIEIANEVLDIEKHKKNTTYRSYAYLLLADAYGGLGKLEEQVKYTKLDAELNDSLNRAAKKEASQEFDRLVQITKETKDKEHFSNLKLILLVSSIFILFLSFSIWLYWRKKTKTLQQKYESIISKIKSEAKTEHYEEINEEQESKSTLNIPDETLKSLLVKLEKFEKSKLFLKKDISRSWLVTHLNTNTKYFSELIKNHRNKNFTDYINGLRINYILKKLVEDPVYREYKHEYLAEECGFNSRQVFILAFKKETGFTPSYFIENLKNDALKQNSKPE